MDFHNFLRSRRSIRRFEAASVPDSIIRRILTTATYAPSAHNRQPWRFVVLTNEGTKLHLANAMALDFRRDLEQDNLSEDEILSHLDKSRSRITSSPVVIILCMDLSVMDKYPDKRRAEAERLMAIQSTANAGLQLLLAAKAEELGCVWTCAPWFAPNTVRETLHLSISWEPQAMFLIGYPAETPKLRERISIEELSIFL